MAKARIEGRPSFATGEANHSRSIGGAVAERVDPINSDTLLFKIKAEDLEHDANGGVPLNLDVSQ